MKQDELVKQAEAAFYRQASYRGSDIEAFTKGYISARKEIRDLRRQQEADRLVVNFRETFRRLEREGYDFSFKCAGE